MISNARGFVTIGMQHRLLVGLGNLSPSKLVNICGFYKGSAIAAQTRNLCSTRDFSALRSMAKPTTESPLILYIPTAEDMEDFGGLLASLVLDDDESKGSKTADLILLDGDLGAGKTALSRGFIQTALGNFDMLVTSPTYLLSNTYKTPNLTTEIQHMDLYRLTGKRPNELRPLNLDHVFQSCVALIEWPERLGKEVELPADRLEICLNIVQEGTDTTSSSSVVDDEDDEEIEQIRKVTITPFGSRWSTKLENTLESGYLEDFLELPPPFEDEC
eukprot:CAMPEP_0198144350 /NCGR_PEP_ID=MMETSP1443-20131203/14889_1 /TAXON_ID=186043 /ORGANISM="Entomoneis sp., Strain CCMP2396" /LENGTH=273 /DNA_ID=CAMNT_0043807727 /DNA_START=182 /DNA_END=1003 /DNA_ORIENTATION=-